MASGTLESVACHFWLVLASPVSLVLSFLFLSSFSSFSYPLLAFPIRHPDEGMAERRQAPGCCEHPVVRALRVQDAHERACDRHAGAVLSTPSVLKR